jgi:hypothetical protein
VALWDRGGDQTLAERLPRRLSLGGILPDLAEELGRLWSPVGNSQISERGLMLPSPPAPQIDRASIFSPSNQRGSVSQVGEDRTALEEKVTFLQSYPLPLKYEKPSPGLANPSL